MKIYLVTTRSGDLLIRAESKSKAIKACTNDIVARLATAEDILNNPELRIQDYYVSNTGPYITHGEEQAQ